LKRVKGIYVLIIQLGKDTDIAVGKLGTLRFTKGLYAYIGSAQNALEKRVERHRRREKRLFWHIDHLLENPDAKILKILYKPAARAVECNVANKIGTQGEAVAGFGCSDCHCESHLFRIRAYDFLREFMQEYAPTSSASA
jgi:Uri superfamily endonuclease